MVALTALLVSLLAVASQGKLTERLVVHEARATPEGYALTGSAPADTVLNMRIAVKQVDIEGMQKVLMDVSTPGNAKYGQHLNKKQVCLSNTLTHTYQLTSSAGRGVH